MYKLCIFILLVLFSSAAFSQSYKTDQLKAIKVNDSSPQNFYSDYQKSKNNLNKQNLVGEHFVFTDYDYATNNSMRPMVDFTDYDNDGISNAIVTAMVRQDAGIRTQEIGFRNQEGFYITNPFNTGQYGWGTIQYANTGPEEGNVFVMGHSGGISRVAKINVQTQTGNEISSFGKNLPSFVYVNDGTIWATTIDANIYKSTDGGVTFDSVIAIGTGDPNVSFSNPENGPAEIPIQATDDGAFIAIVGCWEKATSSDDDITYIYYSKDFGNTWTGKIISIDGEYGQISNRNYAPFIQNYGQVTLNVDNSGIIHVAANGYGNGIIDNDTVAVIPVLYWNSHLNTWIALTDEEFEKVTDAGGASMLSPFRIYAGNGIGNAYPGVSTGQNGEFIFCAWQTSEYDDQGNFVIYPGDGTAETGPILFTDIKGKYSTNGGYDWSDLLIIAEADSVMEQFPNLARRIDFNYIDEKVSGHMMYMIDVRPGSSVFQSGGIPGQNYSDNNTEWRYLKYDLEDLYDIKDQNTELTYSLSLNYPNPFNPETTIKFSLAKASDVSLKVYDLLGTETAVLADGFFNSGSHKVNFNGADLSSGVYIYTLRTAEFTSSKKMLLIK